MFGYSTEKIMNGVFYGICGAVVLFCVGAAIGVAVGAYLL